MSKMALGPTQPPIQWVQEAFSRGGGGTAGAEVKKMWLCTATPPYAFMA
jgi:hypothetical protein